MLLRVAVLLPVIFVGVLLVRTLRSNSREVDVAPPSAVVLDQAAAALRLAQAVRFRTISTDDPKEFNPDPILGLHDFLRTSYPKVHRALRRELVNNYSLLYAWEGTDAGRAKPILLMAHLDVVPVEPGTERDWVEPPFSGRIADGHIWGRGTIDDKSSVLGILEAVEVLLGQGFRPSRTVYIAFGHDEESRGHEGAEKIAALLKSRGVTLDYLLDEGLFIANGLIPGVAAPVAMIGTAEKGWLTLELAAAETGGHASMPPPHTAIGLLAGAIHRLETNPMPAAIKPPVSELFQSVAPEMPFVRRMVFANLWLFGPLVRRQLARSPATNAAIRTTSAVTIAKGGIRDNVLPKSASAVVNFRILPGESTASTIEYARRVIGDPRVDIKPLKREEPSPVSAKDSAGFRTIATTIRQIFPNAVVAPALVVARTDSAHFLAITDGAYRFRPLQLTAPDLNRIHGTNERLAIDSYGVLIKFYVQLLRNGAGDATDPRQPAHPQERAGSGPS